MKPILAITAAIASAAMTVAHAGVKIDIKEDKVSDTTKALAKAFLDKTDPASADIYFAELLSSMGKDKPEMSLDVQMLLAQSHDSTSVGTINPMAGGRCYSNCYTNCHGSRSWR